MGTKIKGLLKGLRYISHIFDDEKEPEMQIGYPTDVKHVAHIGWDGPSMNAPSWMNEFRSASLSATVGGSGTQIDAMRKFPSSEYQPTGSMHEAPSGEPPRPRPSRRKDNASADSPGRDPSKPSRRRPSSGAVPALDSPSREHSEGSRHSRRNRTGGSGGGPDSPSSSSQQDLPSIPKQSRRRKTKGSSSGGSSRSSRNKAPAENGADDRSAVEPAPPSKPEREEDGGL